jgi:hypothetical protein
MPHRPKNTRIPREPQPANMIRQAPRHRTRLRPHPLRNIAIQHRTVLRDRVKRLHAAHRVHVGQEHVVREVAHHGRVVRYAADGQRLQVGAVPDSGVEEESSGADGARREDDFLSGRGLV